MPGDPFDRSSSAPSHTRARGRWGEDEAVRWLRGRGYEVLERNHSYRGGEVDVIALDGETLCFIEIKARSTDQFGRAIEAISPRKQRRLSRAAEHYLSLNPTDSPCRFDVLGMDRGAQGWQFTLVRDAFMAVGR